MKVSIIKDVEKKKFEPVTIQVTFDNLDELINLRKELKESSFKLYELINGIIKDNE